MIRRRRFAALCLASACLPGCRAHQAPTVSSAAPAVSRPAPAASALAPPEPRETAGLAADLDRIFGDPILARALMAVRVDSLVDGRTLYARNADKLVMPASNMKVVTMSVAADRLGWDYRYRTRLEAAGPIADGTLRGDLIVTGTGNPSIGSIDLGHAPLFLEWADALGRAGVRRIAGRIVGDDNAFDDDGLGAGWAWDYLAAGYAAPTGALSYNENVAAMRLSPGPAAGDKTTIELGPPGHLLDVTNEVVTGDTGSAASVDLFRLPGSAKLFVRGHVPAGGAAVIRTAAIDNPTKYFVEGLRLALADRGIVTTGGAWDIDDLPSPPAAGARRLIADRQSEPLSSLAEYAMKVSQNFYGETIFKTLGTTGGHPGSAEGGRQAVRDTLAAWKIPADSLVMYDGSGLSRYNYVTADTLVAVLTHVWRDERLRGPFVAALPVGGHDGTLESRMKDTLLDRHVQAKTGTINNVRALSGYVETPAGDKLAFSMIANNYTASSAAVDAVVEKALTRLVQ